MSIKRLVPLNLPVLDALPSGNRRTGDLVYYSADQKVYVFDGSNWVIASGSVTLSSSTPTANGSASAGTASDASRSDHVHPTDSTRAPVTSPTFTGTVTAPSVSISNGTLYLQRGNSSLEGGEIQFFRSSDNTTGWTIDAYGSGTQPSLRFFDAGSNVKLSLDSNGKLGTSASTTASAGINIPPGTAPTSPANGDVWTTTAGMYVRVNGSTIGPLGSGGSVGTDPTFTGTASASIFSATSNGAGTNFKVGDDIWIGDINVANTLRLTGQQSGTDAYIVFGNSDATALGRTGTGALTYGGNTIWHAGNDGAASGLDADLLDGQHGSYYAPLASPTFTGTPAAPTATAGTNTTQIATTAYVRGEISSLIASAPAALDTLNELAAALGNDANFSTTVTNSLALKAPLASPALTGIPTSPTAAVDTNTTQVATTAFVIGQGYLKSATASSTYAPLASPTFTGTPAAPTAAVGTSTTQVATTAYVRAEINNTPSAAFHPFMVVL